VSDDVQESLRRVASTTTNISNISTAKLVQVSVRMAPLREQERVVRKIDELLSRLDAGVASLKRVQAALKRYRAAVLTAACEGRLVPQDPDDEPAETLLERILVERRARWEEEVRAKGKDPKKAKYVEPARPETEGLPELPEGWCWATAEQLCDRIVDCLHSTPRFVEQGYYCLDSNWIRPGQIVFDRARYVDEPTFMDRNRRMQPRENDVVFSREGALLGVAVQIPAGFFFCLGQRMMIFRLAACIRAEYFEYVMNSQIVKSQYARQITGTAAPHINIGDIRTFVIPLPPLAEQRGVIDVVAQNVSAIVSVEQSTATSLLRASRLRQGILRHAFEGKLTANREATS
jgi:type I restriction enzyme S subunit